ncbi:MAG: hypothetical protein JWM98_256, partial [Thermoleophilia bacterium]|nr:hypothetical protein [Thermoleophilia bacterium]
AKSTAKKSTTKPAARAASKSTTASSKRTTAKAKPAAKRSTTAKSSTKSTTRSTATKAKSTAKSAARKPSGAKAKSAASSARSTAAKAGTSRKPASSSRSTSAASSRVKAASASLGEQVYSRVEEVIATGRTAKDAFGVVARERKMTASNIQQHYYRFKRKAQTSGKKANTSTRKTVGKVQDRALGAAVNAVGKLPAKQRKQVAKGVTGVAKRAQTAQNVGKEVRDDLTQVVEDLLTSFNELLSEARKNPQFRRAEKKIAARFSR